MFKTFAENLNSNFQKIAQNQTVLFKTNADYETMKMLYLKGFDEKDNPFFRKRTEHECSACFSFIKQFGGNVFINDNKIKTIWEFETIPAYQKSISLLNEYVSGCQITDLFVTKQKLFGIKQNADRETNTLWHHLYVEVPKHLLSTVTDISTFMNEKRTAKQVLKRLLDEHPLETIDTIIEIINQNSLYRGNQYLNQLKAVRLLAKTYDSLSNDSEKDLFAWSSSIIAGTAISLTRNSAIGTLIVDINSGTEIDEAVKSFERIVAPENYKRTTAIITKAMIDSAKKEIEALGYVESLERRFATINDITVNNIIFANRDIKKIITDDPFDLPMKNNIEKEFSRVEEISIEDFIKNVIPTTKSIQALVTSKLNKNLVSLISQKNTSAKTMFKWNNGFSWAYNGNIADSSLKKEVAKLGGNVEGLLRFSIKWNDLDSYNQNDFDAHCIEKIGNKRFEISFRQKKSPVTGGFLDIDIINPIKGSPAVENIAFNKLPDGTYEFFVDVYSYRGGVDGFEAEIEFNNNIYKYSCRKNYKQSNTIKIAEVLKLGDEISIKHFAEEEQLTSNTKIWNLPIGKFTDVELIMYSPNYWDEQNGIGNKHYFFMLKDCINDTNPNGFYNEFIDNNLNKHRKVIELLGAKMKVEDSLNQLSGLGFSETIRNELIVKVTGNTVRVLKIKF